MEVPELSSFSCILLFFSFSLFFCFLGKEKQKLSDQVECLKPNFNVPTSQINVQVYKVGTTSRMNGVVILKSQKSLCRQAPYRAYFSYMQTLKQAMRDQNNPKSHNNPKNF